MKRIHGALITTVAVLLSAFPSFAHHSFASEFDQTRVVKFEGVVVIIARMNPHGLIYVDARDAKGVGDYWAVESPSALQMDAYGLGVKGSLKIGDKIAICGYETKAGMQPMKSYQAPEPISESLKSIPRPVLTGRLVYPRSFTLADGKKLQFGAGKCDQ